MPLGSKMALPRGSLAPIDLQWEKHRKFSTRKLQGLEFSYFICSNV